MTSINSEKQLHSMIAYFHMANPEKRVEMLKNEPDMEKRNILCRGAACYPNHTDLAALVVQIQTSPNQNIHS